MRKTLEADDLITLRQIAVELNMSKATLQFYMEQGLIKPDAILARTYVFSRKRHIPIIQNIRKQTAKGIKLIDVKGQMDD